MKSIVHIGNQVSMKEAAEPIGKALVDVLKAISEGRIEREVAIEAVKVVGLSAGVNGVTLSNCSLTNQSPPADYGAFVGEAYEADEDDAALGMEDEGQDREDGPDAEHDSPTAATSGGDAQGPSQ